MAKEFKDWDKHYTTQQLDETRKVWFANYARREQPLRSLLGEIGKITYPSFWVYHGLYRSDYSREQIADAVYTSDGAPEWQRFRCAMKGLSTEEKLAFLMTRWDQYVSENIMGTRAVESIRINNYIGALRRGGQLNDKFDVVK